MRTNNSARLFLTLSKAVALSSTAMLWATPSSASDAGMLKSTVKITSYGVPHISGQSFRDVGFGQGYIFAKQNICEVAENWITLRGQRSKYFDPDARMSATFGNAGYTNAESDFFWKRLHDTGIIQAQLNQPAPLAPTPEVRELVAGYVAGYNHYLAQTGAQSLSDPRCRGKEWVVPITESDVYMRAIQWNLTLSSNTLYKAYVKAAPPVPGEAWSRAATRGTALVSRQAATPNPLGFTPEITGPGSNMIALGKDGTQEGTGMLFVNPHWRWHGVDRWYESQLTVPGKMNVYGASVLGTPVILFGHTANVGWSHTLATPRRYTVYELKLSPESPTSYLYDGNTVKLSPRTVTIETREPDGSPGTRSHTFWETPYGMVIEDDERPWTRTTAYAVRDVAFNFRWLNQQLAMNMAQSVDDIDAVGRKYQGIGWLNTMAVDSKGRAIYRDQTAVPNIPDSKIGACVSSELGKSKLRSTRYTIMDGWRSECEWTVERNTVVPGIFSTTKLPQLTRTDYVTQSNDSYWVNNPRQPLEGYPLVIGDERTVRTLRTRIGLMKIEGRLAGTDGEQGKGFTLDQLERITMNNRSLAGELWRDPLVNLCRQLPPSDGFPQACDVLANWDLMQNPDSRGAVLFRRFFEILVKQEFGAADASLFVAPFNPNDPINTPNGLNVRNPSIAAALLSAVADLTAANIPLDARYGDYHFVERNGKRIAIPGGDAAQGQYNLMGSQNSFARNRNWADIVTGSSYIMWTEFTKAGPVGRSIMTYSQSADPSSAHYSDQTELFSAGKSKKNLFNETEINNDPNLEKIELCVLNNREC